MSKEKKSVHEVYDFVSKRREIRPNNGFIKQLNIFEAMNYTVDKESIFYKNYILELAEHMKLRSHININNIFLENNHTPTNYKCKNCRYYLFNINDCIKHIEANSGNIVCSKEIFIEQVDWITDSMGLNNGKVIFNMICINYLYF